MAGSSQSQPKTLPASRTGAFAGCFVGFEADWIGDRMAVRYQPERPTLEWGHTVLGKEFGFFCAGVSAQNFIAVWEPAEALDDSEIFGSLYCASLIEPIVSRRIGLNVLLVVLQSKLLICQVLAVREADGQEGTFDQLKLLHALSCGNPHGGAGPFIEGVALWPTAKDAARDLVKQDHEGDLLRRAQKGHIATIMPCSVKRWEEAF